MIKMDLAQRTKRFAETDIYSVISPPYCLGRSPLAVLKAALSGGARIVQLRDKEQPERYATDFRKITDSYGALFIMNDSVDLALKYNADGVHLGQRDLPAAQARELAPELIVGVSTHDLEESLAAQAAGASYVNIGPIFPTKTKVQPGSWLGAKIIQEIGPQLKIPFTVMGGISSRNVAEVVYAGAGHIAMITAITQAEDVEAATKRFIKLIRANAA